MGRLASKIAIVTGSGAGIGEAIARRFAAEGATVIIAEIDALAGARVANELNAQRGDSAIFVQTDVAKSNSVTELLRRCLEAAGPPDVLVNNAGINVFGEPLRTTDEAWARCLSVDLDGAWLCCRAVLPPMLEKGDGAIINIASNHSERVIKGTFPYPVAKHGLIGLTRSLALEYADRGISVNAISPGWIDTPLSDRHFAQQPDPIAERRAIEARQPMKRFGRPDEIAAVALLLASNEARFMTGSNLLIDGGVTIRMYE